MKNLKKILALLVAVLMIAVSMSAAFAEDPAYDAKVSVTGLAANDVAHFYKVIEWVGETTDKSDVAGWKAVAPFDSVLDKDTLTAVLVGTKAVPAVTDPDTGEVTTPAVEAKDPTGITADLAQQLAAAAKNNAGVEVTVSDGKAEYTVPNAGMYMALITPADADTIYNPVFVSSDYTAGGTNTIAMPAADAASYSDNAAAKKSTVTLEKTASTTEDTWDDDESSTTAVGDTVSFTVKTTVPGYAGVYDSPKFEVKDTLTALELKTDSVVVKEDGATAALAAGEDKDYTITATKTGYTINFTEKYLKSHIASTKVNITYDAIVTTDAKYAVNQEDNTVELKYTHTPQDETDYNIKKDTTQHYTFSIDAEGAGSGETVKGKKTSEIVKVSVKADGTPEYSDVVEHSEITSTETWTSPLEGAQFGLYTDAACTTPYKPKNADGSAGTTALTATTGEDGRMSFKGLDAGTYYLKEISAPAGYVTNTTPVKVEIIAVTESVKVTEQIGDKTVTYNTDVLKSYTVKIGGQETATYTFTNDPENGSTTIDWEHAELVEKPSQLINTKGTELPSTGGIGTTIFYIGGSILVLAAVILLVTKRRMSAED